MDGVGGPGEIESKECEVVRDIRDKENDSNNDLQDGEDEASENALAGLIQEPGNDKLEDNANSLNTEGERCYIGLGKYPAFPLEALDVEEEQALQRYGLQRSADDRE